MIGGDLSFASGGYARTPIESLLPVELPSTSARSEAMDSAPFRPQLTEAGDRHPITQLAFDPDRNHQIWSELPHLQGTNIVSGAPDDATVLAEHPTLRREGRPMPVISVAERGEGRVMAITSDSTWRWAFEHVGQGGTQREYQSFWGNAIRWLIQDPELKLVRLDMNRDIVAPEQPLDATVRVFAPDYSPAPGAQGRLVIRQTPLDRVAEGRDQGARGYDEIDFSTNQAGKWDLDRAFREPGIYEFMAQVDTESGPLSDNNLILVTPDHDQFRDIVPRNQLLASIASATGGYHSVLPEFQPRQLRFQDPRYVQVHQRELVQLWDNLFLFLTILALLAAEWTLRRRWGRL